MLFSSTVFLFIFIPSLVATYLIVNRSVKPYILLLGSLFFYAWGEPRYLGVMLFICIINYLAARFIAGSSTPIARRVFLFLCILGDLGTLGYFKYYNFFIENIDTFLHTDFPVLNIVMPIGISFFTFQALSYVVDVYRHDAKVQKSFARLTLYISFFPQLIAGPIVKYHDIERDIEHNNSTFDDVVYGIRRFIIGLGKKVLLANSLGSVADQIFNTGYGGADIYVAWLGAITYSLQLYFDFSGYSDMAIGLGRIFGFHFLENFNYPYISKSITEFWRRWHISLGTWFKEYLYIPLGGNRKGHLRTYVNLGIVFLITGMWHGASWTFILWGAWHGLFIIAERMIGVNKWEDNKLPVFRHVYTTLAFVIGWTMFRAKTITEGLGFIATMFHIHTPQYVPYSVGAYLDSKTVIVLVLAMLGCTPFVRLLLDKCMNAAGKWQAGIQNAYLLGVFVLSIAYLAASTYNPFIYFRF